MLLDTYAPPKRTDKYKSKFKATIWLTKTNICRK